MPVSITAIRGPVAARRGGVTSLGRDDAREVLAGHRRLGVDQLARLRLGDRRGEDPAAHRAGLADVLDERARVDAADRRHAAVGEPVAASRARRSGASSRLHASRMIAARAHGRSDSIACELAP